MRRNPGTVPLAADGTDEGKTHRVHVLLRNGYATQGVEPQGWPATGRGACRWTLTGDAFDILQWELAQ